MQKVNSEMTLEALIVKMVLRYVGHVMRSDGSLEKDVMIGKVEGSRRKGRPRMRFLDTVKAMIGRSVTKIKEDARDRTYWRRTIHDITRIRTRIDGTR